MNNELRPSVLIVEDEVCIRDVLVELFDVAGTRVRSAASLTGAKAILATQAFDLIVTDIRLGGRRDGGLQVMGVAGVLSPEATVIALTAFPGDDNRQASVRLGATHFLEKPVALERIAELAAQDGVPTAITDAAGGRHAAGAVAQEGWSAGLACRRGGGCGEVSAREPASRSGRRG